MVRAARRYVEGDNHRILLPGFLISAGLLLLVGGWLTGDYWQSVLIEFGASAFLLVPLYVVERVLERRLRSEVAEVEERTASAVEQRASDLAKEIADVRQDVAATNARLDDLAQEASERLRSESQAIETRAESLLAQPTWEELFSYLNDAVRVRAISEAGVRARLSGTEDRLSLRQEIFSDFSEDRVVGLSWAIEAPDGETLETVDWPKGAALADVFYGIAESLQRLGHYPGDKLFDPVGAYAAIVRTLRLARQHRKDGPVRDLGPIIEIFGSLWALTDYGLECLAHSYYLKAARLWTEDPDLRRHVSRKGWVDADEFDYAFDVARAYHERKRDVELKRLNDY